MPGYTFYPLQIVSKAISVSFLPGYDEAGATFNALDDPARLNAQQVVANALKAACDATLSGAGEDSGTALLCNAFTTQGEVSQGAHRVQPALKAPCN